MSQSDKAFVAYDVVSDKAFVAYDIVYDICGHIELFVAYDIASSVPEPHFFSTAPAPTCEKNGSDSGSGSNQFEILAPAPAPEAWKNTAPTGSGSRTLSPRP